MGCTRLQLFPRCGGGGVAEASCLNINFSPVQRRKTRSARGDEGGVGHIMLSCPKNILSTIIAIYWWVRINSWRILLTSKGKKVTARKPRDLARKLPGFCPNIDTWEISPGCSQAPSPPPPPRLVGSGVDPFFGLGEGGGGQKLEKCPKKLWRAPRRKSQYKILRARRKNENCVCLVVYLC